MLSDHTWSVAAILEHFLFTEILLVSADTEVELCGTRKREEAMHGLQSPSPEH